MKKLSLTIAIVLCLGLTTFANPNGGGLFKRGIVSDEEYYSAGWRQDPFLPALPDHGSDENEDAPLGTGITLMTVFGAAYMVVKKRHEE